MSIHIDRLRDESLEIIEQELQTWTADKRKKIPRRCLYDRLLFTRVRMLKQIGWIDS
jgi:hypothetical protein